MENNIQDIYRSHNSLETLPFYTILGNHDYHGNVSAQILYSYYDKNWILPSHYFSFDLENTRFVALDTQVLASSCAFDYTNPLLDTLPSKGINIHNRNTHYNWIENVLKRTQKVTILIGHVGIISTGFHGNCKSLIENLIPLLRPHKNILYLHGHDHVLQHNIYERIHMFGIGTSGKMDVYKEQNVTQFRSSNYGYVHNNGIQLL